MWSRCGKGCNNNNNNNNDTEGKQGMSWLTNIDAPTTTLTDPSRLSTQTTRDNTHNNAQHILAYHGVRGTCRATNNQQTKSQLISNLQEADEAASAVATERTVPWDVWGVGWGTPGGSRSTSRDTSTLTVLPPSSSCNRRRRKLDLLPMCRLQP